MIRHATPPSDVSLVLFLKAPENAKRRLARQIGELATAAAERLWLCALEDMSGWEGPTWFSPADAPDETWLFSQPGEAPQVVSQRGENLGERINHVDRELRSRGVEKLMFIGTDCPGLDPGYLIQAAGRLGDCDAVLGRARDGGVVLMGARQPWPDLGDLAWSSSALCHQLTTLCEQCGWTIASLEVRADIDTVNDLLAAHHDLTTDERPARRALRRWLEEQTGTLTSAAGEGSKRTR